MGARELLQSGDIEGALELVKQDVKKSPQMSLHRVFLFQLFSIVGQWDRALKQLVVAGELDPIAGPMVECYKHLLNFEAFRAEVFAGHKQPLVFGEPEAWMAGVFEAAKKFAAGNVEQAESVLFEALEDAPASSGQLTLRSTAAGEDPLEFEWIADADCRLGPFLECVVNGKYYWIPMHRIQRMQVDPPADLRDLVWTPCRFTWVGGGEMVGIVPTRYPGTEQQSDAALLLSRKTSWIPQGEKTQFGLGQRMLSTEADDYSLLDISTVVFDPRE